MPSAISLLHVYSILKDTSKVWVMNPGFKVHHFLQELHCLGAIQHAVRRYTWHWYTWFCFMQCFVALKCNGWNPYHTLKGMKMKRASLFYLFRDFIIQGKWQMTSPFVICNCCNPYHIWRGRNINTEEKFKSLWRICCCSISYYIIVKLLVKIENPKPFLLDLLHGIC